MLSKIWISMVAVSIIFGVINGKMHEVSAAVMSGAKSAVELCLAIAGPVCLWTGIMEMMTRSGLSGKIAAGLKPALGMLFPDVKNDKKIMETISSNVTANILGLGNAATPMGIKASGMLADLNRRNGTASDSLCMLVIINTASMQLLPTTMASVRMAYGSEAPFDILPAVWMASVAGILAGVAAAKIASIRKQAITVKA